MNGDLLIAVLLDKYNRLLWKAVHKTKSMLPIELSEERTNLLNEKCKIFPVLDPIEEVMDIIDKDIDLLSKGSV